MFFLRLIFSYVLSEPAISHNSKAMDATIEYLEKSIFY